MAADTLGDLLGPARRSDNPAYRNVAESARSYTYGNFCETGWQVASLLRHYGVHEGSTVGVVDAAKESEATSAEPRPSGTPIPEVVLSLLGAGTLGATVRFDPPARFEGDLLVGPAPAIGAYELDPGCTAIAYGGPPEDPSIVHFETEVWSETPIEPPESVAPETPVLTDGQDTYSHRDLLATGRRFVDEIGLSVGDSVGIDAPLSTPGTVVGGVVAPLLAGATIEVGDGQTTVRIGDGGMRPERLTPSRSGERSSRA